MDLIICPFVCMCKCSWGHRLACRTPAAGGAVQERQHPFWVSETKLGWSDGFSKGCLTCKQTLNVEPCDGIFTFFPSVYFSEKSCKKSGQFSTDRVINQHFSVVAETQACENTLRHLTEWSGSVASCHGAKAAWWATAKVSYHSFVFCPPAWQS